MRNRNFVCLLLCYSIIYSVLNSTMDAISPIFNPYYASEGFISTVAVILIVTSMVTELATGPYLDRTKRYLFTLRITMLATTIITFSMICEPKLFDSAKNPPSTLT